MLPPPTAGLCLGKRLGRRAALASLSILPSPRCRLPASIAPKPPSPSVLIATLSLPPFFFLCPATTCTLPSSPGAGTLRYAACPESSCAAAVGNLTWRMCATQRLRRPSTLARVAVPYVLRSTSAISSGPAATPATNLLACLHHLVLHLRSDLYHQRHALLRLNAF